MLTQKGKYTIQALVFMAPVGMLLNNSYRQYEGGPTVGGFYYLAFTFDGLLTK